MVMIIFSLISTTIQVQLSVCNQVILSACRKSKSISTIFLFKCRFLEILFLCMCGFPQDVNKDNDFPSPWSPFAEGGITTR